MNKLIDMLSERLVGIVALPFIGQLLLAMADGKITSEELQSLSSKARWGELLVLALVMILLKKREK